MNKAFLAIMMFSLISTVSYAMPFHTYHNLRFHYSIDYPTFLIPQGESENGDGQRIKNSNSELIVYGSYYPKRIDEAFNTAMGELKNFKITYSTRKNDYFVISGENATQIAYFKTIFICDENINMQLYYPKADKTTWDPIIARITKSFKYTSQRCKKA